MAEKASSSRSTKRPGTLLQQGQAEEGDPKRRKTSCGYDVDKAVTKILHGSFRDFSSHQTDVMLVDGKTLRERLVADKKQHMQDWLH